MASNFWPVVAIIVTAIVIALSIAIPWISAEVFPWQNLYAQKHGTPTVTTKSYKGRTVLITGASGAFGSRAAKIFADREVGTLVLVDVKDCTAVKEEIETELTKNGKAKPKVLVWQVDMMSYESCEALGKKASELENLDHVLMTAGMLSFNRKESPNGWETSIQVNFISTALLALLFLPVLKSSPGNKSPPVLTFVTTFGVYPASPTMTMPETGSYLRHLSDNKDGRAQAHQYGRSKALLLYFARELATRTGQSENRREGRGMRKVTINSQDPGTSWTGLTNPNKDMWISRMITNFAARDPQMGANALVNGVSASDSSHGKILMDFEIAQYPPFMDRRPGRLAQERLWKETRAELEANAPDVKPVYGILG